MTMEKPESNSNGANDGRFLMEIGKNLISRMNV